MHFTSLLTMILIYFCKTLVDEKNDRVKFDIFLERNEEYKSVTYGCIRFIDSYQFFSSSLDSLVRTLVKNNHKTLESLSNKNDGSDNNILTIVNEIETLIIDDRTIEGIFKVFPDEFDYLEEALNIHISENYLKVFKTVFSDNWKYLTKKIVFPY